MTGDNKNMSDTRRRTWDSEATNQLIDLWPRVSSIVLIALALNRSTSSIQTQASRKGLPRRYETNEKHRRKWTPEELKKLEVTLDKHTNEEGDIFICDIADEMKRSIDAIAERLKDLFGSEEELFSKLQIGDILSKLQKKESVTPKDTRKVARTRNCMTCGRPFWSEGAHNRICQSCKKEDNTSDGYDW